MAHSKGATDAVTALADPANEDLLAHVVGLIAIQPVHGGSAVADLVAKHGVLQGPANEAFEKLLPALNKDTNVGSRDALKDLRTQITDQDESYEDILKRLDQAYTAVTKLRDSFEAQ